MSQPETPATEFTYGEKLALVNQGLMDPKELGVAAPGEAPDLEAMPEASREEKIAATKLGDFIVVQASVVPLQLRALWARQDEKIAMDDEAANAWMENWMKEHANDYLIQGRLNSGSAAAVLEVRVTDPFLGLVEVLRQAADRIEQKYEQERTANTAAPESNG